MKNTSLSGCAASPLSRIAARCGREDAARAAGRPLHGGRWGEARQIYLPDTPKVR